eukprot:7213634-Lingulodinium_polyedra.AAC.1
MLKGPRNPAVERAARWRRQWATRATSQTGPTDTGRGSPGGRLPAQIFRPKPLGVTRDARHPPRVGLERPP